VNLSRIQETVCNFAILFVESVLINSWIKLLLSLFVGAHHPVLAQFANDSHDSHLKYDDMLSRAAVILPSHRFTVLTKPQQDGMTAQLTTALGSLLASVIFSQNLSVSAWQLLTEALSAWVSASEFEFEWDTSMVFLILTVITDASTALQDDKFTVPIELFLLLARVRLPHSSRPLTQRFRRNSVRQFTCFHDCKMIRALLMLIVTKMKLYSRF
jgi:hypothetical protein